MAEAPPQTQRSRQAASRPVVVAFAIWAGVIATGYVWGRILNTRSRAMLLDAPPLFGLWHARLDAGVLPGVAVAGLVVAAGPVVAARLPWRALLIATPSAAAVFAVALALVDGRHSLITAVVSPDEYLQAVKAVGSPGAYLSHFVSAIGTTSIQVRAHPPGMVLTLWGLSRIGLGGPWWAASLMIIVGSSSSAAALIVLRDAAGQRLARSAAPFLVVLPASIWVATSADAFFAGIGAWSVALLVLSTTRRSRLTSDAYALAGGVLGGVTICLTYGAVLLACVPLTIAVVRRRFRPLVVAGLGVVLVVAAFAAGGFWWFDGLSATLHQYTVSVTRDRPDDYILVANLGAFALALGPAVVAGIAGLRDRRAWTVVGGGLLAVLVAEVSRLSKGEVERIWLMFVPWVAVGACTLTRGDGRVDRRWLGAQAATAIGLQVLLRTPW